MRVQGPFLQLFFVYFLTNCTQNRTVEGMDVYSIRHKGLRQFFERGQSRGLPPQQIEKIRRILGALNDAENLDELKAMPGWRLHQLHGDRQGIWSISFTGNWRLTFRVEDDGIYDLNLEDYH